MIKTNVTITSTKSNIQDRANDMLGQIKAALVTAGVITVTADNDPADGTATNRVVEYTSFTGARKCKITASPNGANVYLIHAINSTGTTWVQSAQIYNSNVTSFTMYLFADSRCFVAKCPAGFFWAYKTKNSKAVVGNTYGGGACRAEDVGTVQHYVMHSATGSMKTDAVTSIFVASWGLSTSASGGIFESADDFVADQCVWHGSDKFAGAVGQAIEVATGDYLFIINSATAGRTYLGYMA